MTPPAFDLAGASQRVDASGVLKGQRFVQQSRRAMYHIGSAAS
jgi:hypothetical protein